MKELHTKLVKDGWEYFDKNPLTGNKIYQDGEGSQIEVLMDYSEGEE